MVTAYWSTDGWMALADFHRFLPYETFYVRKHVCWNLYFLIHHNALLLWSSKYNGFSIVSYGKNHPFRFDNLENIKKIIPNGNHCMYTLLHGPKILNVKILIFCYENDQAHFFPLAKCNEQKSSPNAKSQMMIFRKRC